jgi:hypothetical protein
MNKSTTTKPMGASDAQKESIVDQAKGVVSSGLANAKEGVSHQLDVRKDKAIGTIDEVANAVRRTGESLDSSGPIPELAERAANGMNKVARFFESSELTDVVGSVERFARREPALFLGGALALGLVAGRFLKSSATSSANVDFSGDYGGDEGFDEYLDDDDIEEEWDVGATTSSTTRTPSGAEFSSLASKPRASTPQPYDFRSERATDPMGYSGRTQATPTPSGLAGSSSTGSTATGGGVNVGSSNSKGQP